MSLIELRKDKNIIIERYKNGDSTHTIAYDYNCNPALVYYFLKENNVDTRSIKKFFGEIEHYSDQIIEKYNNGDSLRKISKDLKISRPCVGRFLKKNGLNTSRYNSVDPNNLVADKSEQIFQLLSEGMSINQVAKTIGNSHSTLLKFLKNHNYDTKKKMYDVDLNFFKKIDSEAKAWTLGWIYSDGNVMHNCWRIAIQNSDIDALEKIKKLINYSGPIRHNINKANTLMSELYVGRKEMVRDLINLGCPPKKSLIIKFPTEDIIPNNLLHHYVRGIWDGDGSLGDNYCSITGSYNFIHGLVKILPCTYSSLYQSNSCKKRKQDPLKSSWEVRMSRQAEMYKFLTWIYQDSTYYLDRKYQKYQDFLAQYNL